MQSPFRRSAPADPHDPPSLTFQHLVHGPVEYRAIGRGDLKAEGIVMDGHHFPPDIETRAAHEVEKDLTFAVLDGPGWHLRLQS
jgi:hypothetical protein